MHKNILIAFTFLCLALGMLFFKHMHQSNTEPTSAAYDSLWDAVIYGSYDDVQALIAQGVSVTDYETESALHAAAQKGDVAIAQLLLEHGADVHAKSYEAGWTPLHQAACEGHVAIAQLLIKHGADVHEVTQPLTEDVYNVQETPLHVASYAGHLEMVQCLIEHGANVNALSGIQEVYTPLHLAVEQGNTAVVAYLLEHGAHCKDIPGAEPLLVTACSQEHTQMIKMLVEHGCNINEQDKDGITPLMMAVQCNYLDHVRYLLEQHADTRIEDYQGHTALYYAQEQEAKDIENLITTV